MKNTVLVIVLLVVLGGLGFVWYHYFQNPSTPAEGGPVSGTPEFQKKIATLRRLRNLRLDTSIFQDPRFRRLTSGGVGAPTIIPEGGGRSNPFSPF